MEAIVGVWLTSILGAGAFAAAGYVLGQRGVVLPLIGLKAPATPENVPAPAATPIVSTPIVSAAVHEMPTPTTPLPTTPDVAEGDRSTPEVAVPARVAAEAAETPIPGHAPPSSKAPPRSKRPSAPAGPDPTTEETRRNFVPDLQTQAAIAELEGMKTEVSAALTRAEAAAQKARAAEVVRLELEHQIESLRQELKQEVFTRAAVESRAEELGDRLARASEEAAGLRHKVSHLDKQARQLREALQGRVRALTTSEWHRRRDLEDAEGMRVKLRDAADKLERTSLPPASLSRGSSTEIPTPPRSLRPSIDEAAALREQVERLTAENRALRVRALGSVPPKVPSRTDAPEIDLDVYQSLIARLGGLTDLRGAVVADEVGSLLVGSGDLAEALAAFGAYIRDASARTDRLLPLEGVDEVDIRDRGGMLLSTRVVAHAPSEVCLVLLGATAASLAAAKRIVADSLRLGTG
jgi:hypothetical protein